MRFGLVDKDGVTINIIEAVDEKAAQGSYPSAEVFALDNVTPCEPGSSVVVETRYPDGKPERVLFVSEAGEETKTYPDKSVVAEPI